MKRTFMLILSILFVVTLLNERTVGRGSLNTLTVTPDPNAAIESEDHPWGGDDSGIHSVQPKGVRPAIASGIGTMRFEVWASQLAFRLFIFSVTPNTTPQSNPTVNSTGGTN